MDARLPPERIDELIRSGEPVDSLVRRRHGPAVARNAAVLLDADAGVVTYRTQYGVTEQEGIDGILDLRAVRRRLDGRTGPFWKLLDMLSLWP